MARGLLDVARFLWFSSGPARSSGRSGEATKAFDWGDCACSHKPQNRRSVRIKNRFLPLAAESDRLRALLEVAQLSCFLSGPAIRVRGQMRRLSVTKWTTCGWEDVKAGTFGLSWFEKVRCGCDTKSLCSDQGLLRNDDLVCCPFYPSPCGDPSSYGQCGGGPGSRLACARQFERWRSSGCGTPRFGCFRWNTKSAKSWISFFRVFFLVPCGE
jgi:hypothetical protein